jgi:hypothetical protein
MDVAPVRASVTFDTKDPTVGLAAIWVLRPYGDATAVVWAETDGSGNYRFRQDLDWFPPTLQEWTPIPDDGIVETQLMVDLPTRLWHLSADGAPIAEIPMTAGNGRAAILPEAAGPSSTAGTIDIRHAAPASSAPCSKFLSERG